LKIAVAFAVGQALDTNVIASNGYKKRIGEVEIAIADLPREVVSDPQGEAEPVESLRRQHGQVFGPHGAIVVPGLVFDVAHEAPRDAADGVGWALDDGRANIERGELDAVRQLEECVRDTSHVAATGEQRTVIAGFGRYETERFGRG